MDAIIEKTVIEKGPLRVFGIHTRKDKVITDPMEVLRILEEHDDEGNIVVNGIEDQIKYVCYLPSLGTAVTTDITFSRFRQLRESYFLFTRETKEKEYSAHPFDNR